MRIELTKEIIETLAKGLAHSYDDNQGHFINALARELRISMKGDDATIEMQTCYISDKLDNNGREFIKALAEFVKLREEEPKP